MRAESRVRMSVRAKESVSKKIVTYRTVEILGIFS